MSNYSAMCTVSASFYPDIYIPQAFEDAQKLPPLPDLPSEPKEPKPPNKFFRELLILGISTFFLALATQNFFILAFGLGMTITLAWIFAGSYRQRWQNFQKNCKIYRKNYHNFLQAQQSYKTLQNQYKAALFPIIENSYPPDIQNSQAPQGSSEASFYTYLNRYFPQRIYRQYALTIPDYSYPYTPDFCYIHQAIHLDIEIDEPYVARTGKPTHHRNTPKEKRRNQFFLTRNWVVIRFAEEQVCRDPIACCKVVAQVLRELTGEPIPIALRDVADLQPLPRWDNQTALRMASDRHRQTY